MAQPVQIYYSYAAADAALRDALAKHLMALQRDGHIAGWHDRCVLPGAQIRDEVDRHLREADVILLLISPDFLASESCYEVDLALALTRHRAGAAVVLPILVRSVDFATSRLAELAVVPDSGGAVTSWPNQDEAWTAVSSHIRRAVTQRRLERALAEALPESDAVRGFLYHLAMNLGSVDAERPVAGQWSAVVRQVASGAVVGVTLFDLAAHALQRCPEYQELAALREELQNSTMASAGRSASLAMEPDLPNQLVRLAENVHAAAIQQGAKLLSAGHYVAFQAPAGFGAARCLRGVVEQCRKNARAAAYVLTPVPLARSLTTYLDDIGRQLGRDVPLAAHAAASIDESERVFRFLGDLRDGVLKLAERGGRLVAAVDQLERFGDRHLERLVALLGVFAQLWEERVNEPKLECFSVAVAGGESLHHLLTGQIQFGPLSPFRARPISLHPVRADEKTPAAARRIIEQVGGHPELVLWAAQRDGQVNGRPEDDVAILREQAQRFRQPPFRDQLRRLLADDAASWRDQDPVLRWSGWLKAGVHAHDHGFLGPVLEDLARRTVESA